jgi:hypothetical protein
MPEAEDDFFWFAAPFSMEWPEAEGASFRLTTKRIEGGESTFRGGMWKGAQRAFSQREHDHSMQRDVLSVSRPFAAPVRVGFEMTTVLPFMIRTSVALSVPI